MTMQCILLEIFKDQLADSQDNIESNERINMLMINIFYNKQHQLDNPFIETIS
jgi:hypothetical protein